ncbi:integral membrane protein [Streptomyces zinciresistens K42]|uniref:Integral membrane protein n=1 Tax=Streptomyces zinciresistens K42 TaxID=700597 RepID=G2GEB0_9ACTN|nr:hypothetical protein [Streptomyces zinciresistens]EGX58135.1 integral membrane protein [Streptomyces zinciresistens K42]
MFTMNGRQGPRGSSAAVADGPRDAHPLAVMAAAKVIGVLVLALWSSLNGKSAHTLLSARWDSLWYVRVVEHGYDFTLTAPDGRVLSNRAFFPLLPALQWTLSRLSQLTPADAGLLVSAVSSLVAAVGVYRVVGLFTDHRTALLTVALWATLPVSIVQSMAYSESLFTAVAVWALYLALTRRWIPAAVLACAAGLTRPVGLAVALGVWTAVVTGIREQGWDAKKAVSLVVAPAGFASYVLWVGMQEGRLFGYFDVQSAWGNGFDGGISFLVFAGNLATTPPFAGGIALLVAVGLAVWAYSRGFSASYPLPLQVYSGVIIALALGSSGFFGSKPRLLLPVFSLLIPLAALLGRRSTRVRVSVIAATCLLSAVYGAFWLNGSGPP